MIVFGAEGLVVIEFTDEEAELLTLLARQVQQLIDGEGGLDDPALERLFPEAYRDDPDAAAEFRRYTRDGLHSFKSDGVDKVAAALTADHRVELAPQDADRWLRTLTDIRLLVGTRLGLETDDDEVAPGPVGEIYHWLGGLQGAIVDVLDAASLPEETT